MDKKAGIAMRENERDFDGAVALVTGAASGIGAATSRALAARGARVFAVDIDDGALADLDTHTEGKAVVPFRADLANRTQVEGMVDECIRSMGRLDILVSNAGVGFPARAGDLDPEDWRRMLAINLDAAFFASRAALPELIARRGNIVVTSSVSGMGADYNTCVYNTAKAGLLGLMRNLAVDYAKDGVRANAVSPGYTITGLTASLPESVKSAFEAAVPMRRGGTSEEVAEVICFLASNRASYVTGQNIAVDGGLTAHTGQPNFMDILAAE